MTMQHFKISFACLLMEFIFTASFAQFTGHVDSVQMNPAQPTSLDQVCFLFFNSFPTGECYNHQSLLTINNTSLMNVSEYCLGNYFYICDHVDTICIAPLEPGFYSLNYILKTDDYWSGCDYFFTADSVFILFTVQSQEYVVENTLRGDCLTWRHLAGEGSIIVNIDCNSNNSMLLVSNVLGRVVFIQKINQDINQIKITLDNEIYFVTLLTVKGELTKKVMVLN